MGRNPGAYGVLIVVACLAVAVAEASGVPEAVEVDRSWLRVRESPSDRARKLGVLRQGAVVRVSGRERGHGCHGGWLRVEGEGFVCSDYVSPAAAPSRPSPLEPQSAEGLSRYGRVRGGPSPLCRNPRALSRDVSAECRVAPLGALLRLDHAIAPGQWAWRTVAGEFVRASRVEPVEAHAPTPGGELGGAVPEGTVILRQEAPVRAAPSPEAEQVGTLAQYARARVVDQQGGYLRLESGGWVPRRAVRRVRLRERPEGVGAERRWLAVDLEEQTLVAYEGDRPAYATLASTGRGRHWTPEGVYRIHKKALSATMADEDRRNSYLVEDVPWVLYYDESHAVHGAFWHDEFGDRRSHGCVNLALEDARWVFDFVDPQLPRGWHAALDVPGRRGSPVVVFR